MTFSLQDLVQRDGADVLDFAGLDVLGRLAQLGGQEVVELGRGLVGAAPEDDGDDVIVGLGHLAGGQVADQTLKALLGLVIVLKDLKDCSQSNGLRSKALPSTA